MEEELGQYVDGVDGSRDVLYKRDFWRTENLRYSIPHPRMRKVARIVNDLARDGDRTLLDVGCGPGTLSSLLRSDVHYHGIDIAIGTPAPNLLEADLLETPIKFSDMRFDIIVAQGFFEYIGKFQSEKLAEIAKLLNGNGTFIATYVNFDHRDPYIYYPYSNVKPFAEFRDSVQQHFDVKRVVPTSYHWKHRDSERRIFKLAGLHGDLNVPIIGHAFAVQYILVCSKRC